MSIIKGGIMSVSQTLEFRKLSDFSKQPYKLTMLERKPIVGAEKFFQTIIKSPFRVIGKVYKKNSTEDIESLLKNDVLEVLQVDPFYKVWVSDMAQICEMFCDTLSSDAVGFCLGTDRGCRRYHIDNVSMRLLVTYYGKGTEWLPDAAADRRAFELGEPNENILKVPSKRQYMNSWDIAIFRGGSQGLLHRTPDIALKFPSLLLRLDHPSFWDKVQK